MCGRQSVGPVHPKNDATAVITAGALLSASGVGIHPSCDHYGWIPNRRAAETGRQIVGPTLQRLGLLLLLLALLLFVRLGGLVLGVALRVFELLLDFVFCAFQFLAEMFELLLRDLRVIEAAQQFLELSFHRLGWIAGRP